MPFDYDDSQWPIIKILASGDSSDEDMDLYIGTLEAKLMRKEEHVVIVDATHGKSLKGTHRKRVANWNKRHAENLARYRLGLCLVTNSTLLRGFITAVYWLFPAPFPYKAVDTLREAEQWANHRLMMSQRRAG